jgi:hypothetical protein
MAIFGKDCPGWLEKLLEKLAVTAEPPDPGPGFSFIETTPPWECKNLLVETSLNIHAMTMKCKIFQYVWKEFRKNLGEDKSEE